MASPVAGVVMLAALGYTIYWVVRSRRRWRTIMYILLSIVATALVGVVLTWLLPRSADAIGLLAGNLAFVIFALTASGHARFTIRHQMDTVKEEPENIHARLKARSQQKNPDGERFVKMTGLGPMTIHSTGPAEPAPDSEEPAN